MSLDQTAILKESWDADRRLAELGLERVRLLKVRDIALAAAADATAFHPANASGTLSYQHGTWALRDEFVGEAWQLERPGGVEAIYNPSLQLRIAFANVDAACSDEHQPAPRSHKGSGAERASGPGLFGELPRYAPNSERGIAFYYLMVANSGAAELSRPVIKNGTFSAFIERIYLSNGDDMDRVARLLDSGDIADNFDPQVARK